MKVRSFLAFDISDEMRQELAKVISLFAKKVSDVDWVRPELMHGTIRFFGEVEEELLLGKLSHVIESEVRHQSKIELFGRGIGVFPNWRYPKILWAGLSGDVDAVMSLYNRLEDEFESLGLKSDKRQLRLHLTLGRLNAGAPGMDTLVHLVEKMSDREFGNIEVGELVLYQSVLQRTGPIYTVLKKFKLGN